jgi:peptidylprolyl isomerase
MARLTRLLTVAVVVTALAAVACRSGSQVPKETVSIPVIKATVGKEVCLNDRYPSDAPQFGDNATIQYADQQSGLRIYDHEVGTGATPSSGDVVTAHYTGFLEDGCIFDSSHIQGRPAKFSMGRLIPGWQEGLSTMRVGGKRRLEIPSELGYGAVGFPGVIPPGATLIFEMELVETAAPTPTPESATPTP